MNATKQPVVTAPKLRNVPADGVFAFEPGGYFGVYNPDTFWFDTGSDNRPEVVTSKTGEGR